MCWDLFSCLMYSSYWLTLSMHLKQKITLLLFCGVITVVNGGFQIFLYSRFSVYNDFPITCSLKFWERYTYIYIFPTKTFRFFFLLPLLWVFALCVLKLCYQACKCYVYDSVAYLFSGLGNQSRVLCILHRCSSLSHPWSHSKQIDHFLIMKRPFSSLVINCAVKSTFPDIKVVTTWLSLVSISSPFSIWLICVSQLKCPTTCLQSFQTECL